MKLPNPKQIFCIACIAWILLEIANVYFIMPLPGSQELNNLQLAYFLSNNRWWFRILFTILMLASAYQMFQSNKITGIVLLSILGFVIYYTNFEMSADMMFRQPNQLIFSDRLENKVDEDRIILGLEHGNEAKAYPMQFLAYHHYIIDSIGDKELMITYCTVCRTGRAQANGVARALQADGREPGVPGAGLQRNRCEWHPRRPEPPVQQFFRLERGPEQHDCPAGGPRQRRATGSILPPGGRQSGESRQGHGPATAPNRRADQPARLRTARVQRGPAAGRLR